MNSRRQTELSEADLSSEGRSVQDVLRTSEAHLLDAQKIARLGSFHYDAASDRSYWSAQLFRLYGLEPDRGPLSIDEARSYLHPDDRGVASEMVRLARESGEVAEGTYRIVRADGEVRYHHAISRYSFDEKGNIQAVDGTIQDVTEQTEIELKLVSYKDELERLIAERNAELKRSDTRFQKVFEESQACLFVVNIKTGTVEAANQKFHDSLGYDQDSLKDARALLSRMMPDSVYRDEISASFADSFQKIAEGQQETTPLIVRLRTKTGLDRYFERSFASLGDSVLVSLLDVSDRVSAETKLQEEKKFSETLIDDLPGLFFAIDNDDRIVRWNANLQDLVSGRDPREGLTPFLSAEFQRSFAQAAAEARAHDSAAVELRFELPREASSVWYLISFRSMRIDGRSLLLGTGMDITVRKKAERESALLQSVTRHLAEALDYRKALQGALGLICTATGCEYGESWLPDPSSGKLVMGPAWFGGDERLGVFTQRSKSYTFTPSEGFVGEVWACRAAKWIEDKDASAGNHFVRNAEFVEAGLKAMWGVPVMIGSRVLAVLCFGMRRNFKTEFELIELTSVVVHALGTLLLRKQSEDELRKLSQAVRQSPVSVLVADRRGNIEFTNPKFTEVTGYTAEEVLGKNPRILNSGKLPRDFYRDLWRTILSGSVWKGEFINRKKSGEEYVEQASIAPIIDAEGEITHFVAVKEDITEQKRVVELLSLSERRMDLAFSGSGFGWWDWDLETGQVVSSPVRWRALGYEEPQVREAIDWWRSLVHPEDAAAADSLVAQVLNAELESFDVRLRYRTASGGWFWFRDRGKVVEHGPEGNAKKWIGTSQDINDIVNAEQEMLRARTLAEEASRAKSEFLATVSHEIRTPMNAIIGLSYLALDTTLDRKQRNYVERIRESGVNLLGIINDILDFSKIESGKLVMERIDFSLDSVFSQVLNAVAEKIRMNQLEYSCVVDPDVPKTLVGDPLRLQQVLLNLVGNAIKFTPAGRVAVRVKSLRIEKSGTALLEFSVADTGIGLSDDERARLFRPFSQADASTTRKYGGTGLGLAISANLVERMGGSIKVSSEKGKGSVFSFTAVFGVSSRRLPNKRDPVSIRPPSALSGAAAGARILVVEDNPLNRDVARELLVKAGYQVATAGSGEAAVALFSAEASAGRRFKAVLMDLRMPGIDGYETARRLRKLDSFVGVPVIAMSADAMNGVREAVAEAGMADYISKPIIPDQLYSMLGKWVAPGEAIDVSAASRQETPAAPYSFDHLKVEKGLAIVGGDISFYRSVLRKFLDDYSRMPESLSAVLSSGDTKQAMLYAHTLKGASSTVGGVDLAREAAEWEAALKRGEAAALSVDALRRSYEELAADMREFLARTPREPAGSVAPAAPVAEPVFELIDDFIQALSRDIPTAWENLEKIRRKLFPGAFEKELQRVESFLSDFDIEAAREAASALEVALRTKEEPTA